VTRARMRGPGSGVEVNAVSSGLWTIRDGKGRSFKLYQSKADALEAAGLRGVGDRSFGRKRRLALKAALSVSREILRGRCRARSGPCARPKAVGPSARTETSDRGGN
jgi:hypothetical protein